MTPYHRLDGRRRRRHLRLLRQVIARRAIWVRWEHQFRMVERLHKAGLVVACVSKFNFLGEGRRPFRELAVFADEREARKHYSRFMPR